MWPRGGLRRSAPIGARRTFIHVESELSDSDDDAEGIPMMHCRTDPGFPRYHDATPKFATPKMAVVEEGVETPSPKRGHRGRQHVDSDEVREGSVGMVGARNAPRMCRRPEFHASWGGALSGVGRSLNNRKTLERARSRLGFEDYDLRDSLYLLKVSALGTLSCMCV